MTTADRPSKKQIWLAYEERELIRLALTRLNQDDLDALVRAEVEALLRRFMVEK